MSFFNVLEAKCRRCGICIAECPNRLILADDETGLPKLRIHGEEDCILCGHCVAVCPFHALNLAPLPEDGFVPVNKALDLPFEQVDQFLKSRRSIRAFKKKEVADGDLHNIMDAARFAPTASHRQAIRWLLVKDPVKTHRVAEMVIEWMASVRKNHPDKARAYKMAGLIAGWRRGHDMILRGAPHLAVAYSDTASYWYGIDAAIALTYVELAAHALGIGACWAGFFTYAVTEHSPLRELLGIPDDAHVHGAQMLGYPACPYPRLPWRKPLDLRIV